MRSELFSETWVKQISGLMNKSINVTYCIPTRFCVMPLNESLKDRWGVKAGAMDNYA